MASNAGRQLLQRSTSTARSFHLSSTRKTQTPSNLGRPAPSIPRLSGRRNPLFSSSRMPVELGCAESLMPLHSVTASALLKSMLSSKVGQWGSLSEASNFKNFESRNTILSALCENL